MIWILENSFTLQLSHRLLPLLTQHSRTTHGFVNHSKTMLPEISDATYAREQTDLGKTTEQLAASFSNDIRTLTESSHGDDTASVQEYRNLLDRYDKIKDRLQQNDREALDRQAVPAQEITEALNGAAALQVFDAYRKGRGLGHGLGPDEAKALKDCFEEYRETDIPQMGKAVPKLTDEESDRLVGACIAVGREIWSEVGPEVYVILVQLIVQLR